MSTTFCSLPWVHLSVDGMGHFYNCCFGFTVPTPSRDEDGNILKAGQPGAIAKHWHSNFMQGLRKSLNNDHKHPSCIGCWRVEETGAESFRPTANLTYPIDNSTQQSLTPRPLIRFVDLRFGNLCNLACRMCGPYSSLKMSNEHALIHGPESIEPFKNMDWYKSRSFWEELYQYRDGFEKLHLAGGEPLLIKECWEFLRDISKNDSAKNIVLSYNTNLTQLPSDAKEVWSKFKAVDLIVSMDGVGKVNEFIRHPLKWNEFERNLLEIENNHAEYNVRHCQIQTTVQAYNIMRLEEICDYVAGFKFIKRFPLINSVYDPEYFSPVVFPESYRMLAAQNIEKYVQKIESGWNSLEVSELMHLKGLLMGINNLLKTQDKSHLFKEFLRCNEVFDQTRNQNFLTYLPELELAIRKE